MRGRTIRRRRVGALGLDGRKRSNTRFVRQFLLEQQGWKCAGCRRSVSHYPNWKGKQKPPDMATLDHRCPRSKGGSNNTRRNLQIMCPKCNGGKGDSWDGDDGCRR